MKYRVHRIDIKSYSAQETLENFLNQLAGDVLAIIPIVTPTFRMMGATSKVSYLLIVERIL